MAKNFIYGSKLIRGIRDSIPTGYMLGRSAKGKGPVQLIKMPAAFFTPGGGGSGGGGTDTGITQLTGNVTAGPGNGSQAATIPAATVTEAMQVLADNTTQDVSTTKHGYAPKAPNDSTKFLNGVGAYAVPAGGTGMNGALELISEVVTSSSAANVTFSSISSGYRDLLIMVRGRGDDAAADVIVQLQFNGDTGANYDYQQTFLQNNATFVQGAAQALILAGQISGAGSTASFGGGYNIYIYDYAGTTFYKTVACQGGENRTGTGQRTMVTSGQWRSTAAITSVKVYLNAGNFADNSVVSLFGVSGTAATGTQVTAGTYTPTLTAVTNVAASTAYQCQYMRVGATVTVSGKVDVDPTATGQTQLGISLPIASNFGAVEDCGGTAFAPGIAGQGAAIEADTTNDRAQMEWIAVDITNKAMFFTFTYQVI